MGRSVSVFGKEVKAHFSFPLILKHFNRTRVAFKWRDFIPFNCTHLGLHAIALFRVLIAKIERGGQAQLDSACPSVTSSTSYQRYLFVSSLSYNNLILLLV